MTVSTQSLFLFFLSLTVMTTLIAVGILRIYFVRQSRPNKRNNGYLAALLGGAAIIAAGLAAGVIGIMFT